MRILKGKEAKDAQIFLDAAAKASTKSRCLKRPRGCVLVKDGQIISEGANAPVDNHTCKECLRDKKKPVKFKEFNTEPCYSLHAEQRAILNAYKKGFSDLTGSKIYFTRLVDNEHSPVTSMSCSNCSKLLLEASVESFVCITRHGITEFPITEMNNLTFTGIEQGQFIQI